MEDKETLREHKKRIDAVIDFILKNLYDDISLQRLAGVANYSPFHLQKLFKQIIGESPKQYIIKLRIDIALHFLIIHPHKSIMEISIECGFSSPAVFSRAIKSYFGVSPVEMRNNYLLSPKKRIQIIKNKNLIPHPQAEFHPEAPMDLIEIQVKKVETITGFYLIAPFDNPYKIQQSFKEIIQLASANDVLSEKSKIFGIISPHQGNIYKTFVSVNKIQKLPSSFKVTEIKGGKYAAFKITGDKKETLNAGQYFFHKWLPESGYKIADFVGFETFSKNPATTEYKELERELYVPIEPK